MYFESISSWILVIKSNYSGQTQTSLQRLQGIISRTKQLRECSRRNEHDIKIMWTHREEKWATFMGFSWASFKQNIQNWNNREQNICLLKNNWLASNYTKEITLK